MTQPRWLRNVRPYGSNAEDFLIENGLFTQRRPASPAALGATDIDGQHQLMTPRWSKAMLTWIKPCGVSLGARTAPGRRSRITSATNVGY